MLYILIIHVIQWLKLGSFLFDVFLLPRLLQRLASVHFVLTQNEPKSQGLASLRPVRSSQAKLKKLASLKQLSILRLVSLNVSPPTKQMPFRLTGVNVTFG
ncbi:hypothetical protein D0T56_03740 [Dysgonomonas sp. 520]|nr:hypothetical protein [Dysgonomonas sp. 520]